MTIEMKEKWESVFADTEYATKLLNMSPEDALKDLQSKGYDFTSEDMAEMGAEIQKMIGCIGENGEINEEMLAEITGGGHVGSFFGGIGLGIVAGIAGFMLAW